MYFPILGPGPGFPVLDHSIYLSALALDLCLTVLVRNLHLPALVYNVITSPRLEFCINRPCLKQSGHSKG